MPADATTESVWDYPRPPRVERSPKLVRVVLGGGLIAGSGRAHRVLGTSHPPVYYVPRAAWFYPEPSPGFESIRDAVAFYPALMDECTLDGEVVTAQPGDFYGGWISGEVAGLFKGGPGTLGW
jgi:uncharacterized protein (DUF427 family)